MVKVIRFIKRRKDLTHEQFKAYWLNRHSQLEKMVMEQTPIRKIVASFPTGEMIGGKEPPFDGMVELYFDGVDDMRAMFAGEFRRSCSKTRKTSSTTPKSRCVSSRRNT